MPVDIQVLRELMDKIETGYKERGIEEVEYYRGISGGFDIVRTFLRLEENRQNAEQDKQFGGGK